MDNICTAILKTCSKPELFNSTNIEVLYNELINSIKKECGDQHPINCILQRVKEDPFSKENRFLLMKETSSLKLVNCGTIIELTKKLYDAVLNYLQMQNVRSYESACEASNSIASNFVESLGQTLADSRDVTKQLQLYYKYLIKRYWYLDSKGKGITSNIKVPLLDTYVEPKAAEIEPGNMTWNNTRTAYMADITGLELAKGRPVTHLLHEVDGLFVYGNPGSGKTTLLKYIALCLAMGELKAVYPKPVVPIIISLGSYAEINKNSVPFKQSIINYITHGLDNMFLLPLKIAWEAGRALFLLDGLDEIPYKKNLRGPIVKKITTYFSSLNSGENKIILTTRFIENASITPSIIGFGECMLLPFDNEDIKQHIHNWSFFLNQNDSTNLQNINAHDDIKSNILLYINQNKAVSDLASNPLLLTILVLMSYQKFSMPQQRVQLYEKYLEALIFSWGAARSIDGIEINNPNLDQSETKKILGKVARWMHERGSEASDIGFVKIDDLCNFLADNIFINGKIRSFNSPNDFIKDVQQNSALLELVNGGLRFIHLTFQEYLASRALAGVAQTKIDDLVDIFLDKASDDNWIEVIILTIAYIGIIQERDQPASEIILNYVRRTQKNIDSVFVLAGKILLDIMPDVTKECEDNIVEGILDVMRGKYNSTANLRVEAGNILGKIGDPRPELSIIDRIQFCFVPKGDFMRGKAPGIVCNEINYDYLISKYPITICQFQNFIENNHNYFPKDPSIKYKIKNHPVTSVCWQDCLSFCEWLTLKWQAEYNLPNSWIVRIPTENEWEKAVRGGIHLPSHPIEFEISDKFWLSTGDFILSTNPNPIREFPYGKKAETDYIDKNIVNYSMSGISNTNALGCFPMNISPYGVAEMSGNVWEWTLDSNPYEKGDKRFSIGNAPKAVRGGSFFFEEKYSKSYERGKKEAKIWAGDVGFRLVVSLSFSELEDQVQGGGRC